MALTLSTLDSIVPGSRRSIHLTVAFDASYPTGGYAITPAQLGLQNIINVRCDPQKGYTFEWDYVNGKLIAYQGDNANAGVAPGIQVAATTNLSAVLTAVRLTVTGY